MRGTRPGDEPLRVPARAARVPRGGGRVHAAPLWGEGRSVHSAPPAARLEGGDRASRDGPARFRGCGDRARARLRRVRRGHRAGGRRAVPLRAPAAHRFPARAGGAPGRCGAARQARVSQLPEQPDGSGGDPRVSRGNRCVLPRARHRHRVRQSVLRDHVRRLRRAEYLRDRRRMGRRRGVPFALEDVLHDRVAARLGGGTL